MKYIALTLIVILILVIFTMLKDAKWYRKLRGGDWVLVDNEAIRMRYWTRTKNVGTNCHIVEAEVYK